MFSRHRFRASFLGSVPFFCESARRRLAFFKSARFRSEEAIALREKERIREREKKYEKRTMFSYKILSILYIYIFLFSLNRLLCAIHFATYTRTHARAGRAAAAAVLTFVSLSGVSSNSFASSAYLSSLLGVAVLVVLVLVFVEAATLSATTDRRVPLLRVRAVFSPQLAKRGGFLRLGQTELGDPLAVGAELVGYAQGVLLVQHRDKRELTVFVFFVFEFGEDFRIDVERGER